MCLIGGSYHACKTFSIHTKKHQTYKNIVKLRAGSKQCGSHSFISPVLKFLIYWENTDTSNFSQNLQTCTESKSSIILEKATLRSY